MPIFIKAGLYAIGLLAVAAGIRFNDARIRACYSVSFSYSTLVLLALAFFVLPSVGFALLSDRCNGLEFVFAEFLFFSCAMIFATLWLCKQNDVNDSTSSSASVKAAIRTFFTFVVLTTSVGVGMIPPAWFALLYGMPSGGMHACR